MCGSPDAYPDCGYGIQHEPINFSAKGTLEIEANYVYHLCSAVSFRAVLRRYRLLRWSRLLPLGPLNKGRGQNPGDTAEKAQPSTAGSSLNEGRSRDPGDTARPYCQHVKEQARSTKAGAETPATQGVCQER